MRLATYNVRLLRSTRDGIRTYPTERIDRHDPATAAWDVLRARYEKMPEHDKIYERVVSVWIDGEEPWYPMVNIDTPRLVEILEHEAGRGILRETQEKEQTRKAAREAWMDHEERAGRKIIV